MVTVGFHYLLALSDSLDSPAVSVFVVILVELANTVFANSTNITTNIETAVLSMIAPLWLFFENINIEDDFIEAIVSFKVCPTGVPSSVPRCSANTDNNNNIDYFPSKVDRWPWE